MKKSIFRLGKFLAAIALFGVMVLTLTHNTLAAPQDTHSITVNSALDSNQADSVITLREALLLARNGTNAGDGLGRPLTNAEVYQLYNCQVTGYNPDHWWIDSSCGANVAETILLNLPNCPCTIAPTSALPFVASDTTIDAYTIQNGASPNNSINGMNANIMVRLYGGNISGSAHGLDIGYNVTIKGLEIYNFPNMGINASSGKATIVGNVIDFNGADGIALYGTNNHVGGNALADRNSIYENGWHGVEAFGGSTGNQIVNNLIGVVPDGEHGTGNTYSGVSIYSSSNYIMGNHIANNGDNGILVLDGTHNNFYNNSFHDNGKLAVDLGNNGVTKNDGKAKDADTGANNLQNFPVLTDATAATKTVKGKLVSHPNTSFQIDFYSTPACDANGFGEGKTHLGSTNVNTNANGVAKFNVAVNKFNTGSKLTAVATGSEGTSEFSKCFSAQ